MIYHTDIDPEQILVTYIQSRRGQQDVRGLGDVGSVQTVVVRHVGVVVVLQGQHERHKGVGRNLERPHQVSLLSATQTGIIRTVESC